MRRHVLQLAKFKNVTKWLYFFAETEQNVKEMTRGELYNYIKKCPERLIDDKINSMGMIC